MTADSFDHIDSPQYSIRELSAITVTCKGANIVRIVEKFRLRVFCVPLLTRIAATVKRVSGKVSVAREIGRVTRIRTR